MTNDEIEKLLEELGPIMEDLAQKIMCPKCCKFTKGPFYNLGKKFNWAEGCKKCYDEET